VPVGNGETRGKVTYPVALHLAIHSVACRHYTAATVKVDKDKFDGLLKRLLQAKPAPKSSIKTSRKKKTGKVIPAMPESDPST
jgi:hypothetical protein